MASKGSMTMGGLSKTNYFRSIESKYNDFNTLNTTALVSLAVLMSALIQTF